MPQPQSSRFVTSMGLLSLLVIWLAFGTFPAAGDTPKADIRFFNDSAKAANFYVDGKLACSVPANPEENLAHCDAEVSSGKHKLGVRGPKLQLQSCEVGVGGHAEADLSKGERFRCWPIMSVD